MIKQHQSPTNQNLKYLIFIGLISPLTSFLEIEINKELETLIKIEICEIFEYLLDWREDFFIQNAMNYFTDRFYEQNKKDNEYLQADKQKELSKELLELLPENMFGVGQPIFQKDRKFKMFKPPSKGNFIIDPHLYTEQVENIDDIIRRPFVETLLLSFYFTEDPDLQNKLSNLIYRSFTQKARLIENLKKINLVNSGKSDSSYQQMSKLISRLKALISYSQSWLQIIEQNIYNEKAEENLDITHSKLNKLLDQFNNCTSQELEIKQKIFKHLEGHKVLLKFLEQGTGVLQANANYFSSEQTSLQKFSYKKQFMTRVIDVFQICHKILSFFCQQNKKIQKTLFKNYRKLLFNQSYINLGQVEFICDIFRSNKELSVLNNEDYLAYMTNLIEIHGQQPQFLELFKVLISNYTIENNEVQKKVIQHLFDLKNIKVINPFADENTREDRVNQSFLELSQLERGQTMLLPQQQQQLQQLQQQSQQIFKIDQNQISLVNPQGKSGIIGRQQTTLTKQGTLLPSIADFEDQTQQQLPSQNQIDNKKFDKNKTILFYDTDINNPNNTAKEYKVKLIEVVTQAFKTTDIGITFIYKSFLSIRVSSLFKLLVEEMKTNSRSGGQKGISISRKQNITDLLLIYFYKLDQSIAQFQRSSKIFISCVETEIFNMRANAQYQASEKEFLIDNFLPLVNEYNDNFLKDTVLLAIQQHENTEDAQNQRIVYDFAAMFLKNINYFVDFKQFSKLDKGATSKLKNIAILANNFRINFNPPEILQVISRHTKREIRIILGFLFLQLQVSNITLHKKELIHSMQLENKEDRQIKKLSQPRAAQLKAPAGNVFAKFRNCVNMIIFLRLSKKKVAQSKQSGHQDNKNNMDEKLGMLEKLEKESRYLKLWTAFKQQMEQREPLKEAVKNEHRYFRDSLMQFDGFIENKKEALEDLLVSKEDLIVKFLGFIRFWKEMGSQKGSVIFVLKTLRHLIERSEKESSFDNNGNNGAAGQSEKSSSGGSSQNGQGMQSGVALSSAQQIEQFEAKVKRQNIMDGLNSTIITTTLLLNENTRDKRYLYYLFRLMISLLDGGNSLVQKTLYQFFTTNSHSEYFFSKIFFIIDDEIRLIKKSDGKLTSIGSELNHSKPLIENVLRLIQLMCEGHNLEMQDYMRMQFNSKINYDLVTKITELLVSIKVSNSTYQAVKQCFDTLTEMVQGPCKQNQISIMNTKFLEYAVDILREEDSVYVVKQTLQEVQTEDNNKEVEDKKHKKNKDLKGKQDLNQKTIELAGLPEQPKNQIMEKITSKMKKKPNIIKEVITKEAKKAYIVRVKHKCVITLLSLLELNENDMSVVNRIRRTVPLPVLINEMIQVHLNYKAKYKEEYFRECFNQADKDQEFKNRPEKPDDSIVLELGFNCFILINVFLQSLSKIGMEPEYHEVHLQIKEFQAVKAKDENAGGLLANLQDLQKMTTSLVGAGLGAVKAVGQKAISLGSDEEKEKEKERLRKAQEEQDHQKKKTEALQFFSEKTLHIEILRDNKLSKVYFPRLPFFTLPKEYKGVIASYLCWFSCVKNKFHDEVDYNSDKGKLRTLIETSKSLISIMIHEEDCREMFRKFRSTGFIAEHKDLWENLAFYCNCALNFIIIASYGVYQSERDKITFMCENDACDFDTEFQKARMDEPRIFGVQSYDWTKDLLFFLGIANLVLSSLIFVFFFIKRAPVLLKDIWLEWFEEKNTYVQKLLKLVWTVIMTMKAILSDFDFVYYTLYMGFCVIGLVIHPFFFGFLTVDFLRFKILKNVVKAVWEPRVDMALTFMIFLLLEYYFTLIGYLLLYNQYINTQRYGECDVLWRCFITTFDWTFKATGSIGGILSNSDYDSDVTKLQPIVDTGSLEIMNVSYLARFFFDNIFMLTMVILLINMVAGIIIENFSALKDETQEKDYALKRKCFVCGIDRELIEKAYDDVSSSNGFLQHISRDHYMWDYVYFNAYLKYKDQKEFTGNESYVFEQFKTTDVSWFPVGRAIYVQDEDTKIRIERKTKLELINHQTKMLQEKLEALRLKVNVVKSETL